MKASKRMVMVSMDESESGPEIKRDLVQAILECGGLTVLLPTFAPFSKLKALVDHYRPSLVVISGGHFDHPPSLYGARNRFSRKLNPARSRFEAELIRHCAARKIPLLGICGGMQLLNIVFGGSLIQDIRTELPESLVHEGRVRHRISLRPDSWIHSLLKRNRITVNSSHHQAVDRLAPRFQVAAQSSDGVVEAIEANGARFGKIPSMVGVQWHPERERSDPILHAMINA